MASRVSSILFTISIHALREEGDQDIPETRAKPNRFLSTPSARRATLSRIWELAHLSIFLSTPSARRATLEPLDLIFPPGISIHALREEGDMRTASRWTTMLSYFYPRPPRGGRQSRRSWQSSLWNFYPRPPRGGRPLYYNHDDKKSRISIHALREEGDKCRPDQRMTSHNFYPRPPRGGRRYNHLNKSSRPLISIHALREEGDTERPSSSKARRRFLSTPSARRATSPARRCSTAIAVFLSTPSARRATTARFTHSASTTHFYPRPPRGGRRVALGPLYSPIDFYPRPPRGGRQTVHIGRELCHDISIHALREEGDAKSRPARTGSTQFLSTPSARRATTNTAV